MVANPPEAFSGDIAGLNVLGALAFDRSNPDQLDVRLVTVVALVAVMALAFVSVRRPSADDGPSVHQRVGAISAADGGTVLSVYVLDTTVLIGYLRDIQPIASDLRWRLGAGHILATTCDG